MFLMVRMVLRFYSASILLLIVAQQRHTICLEASTPSDSLVSYFRIKPCHGICPFLLKIRVCEKEMDTRIVIFQVLRFNGMGLNIYQGIIKPKFFSSTEHIQEFFK